MKPTAVLSKYFGMKELGDLEGYTNSDGTPCATKLQAFAAEIRKLLPSEKDELVKLAAAELGVQVEH